ncbi:MAG TPA: GH3 auxin-responsive promoter family protein [Minicystis sp.]|nr:GH3 auxin-responsive promoter family protein [Minicystis sp.]
MRRAVRLKSIPAAGITGPALWGAAQVRVAIWERRARSPREIQLRHLLEHCRAAAKTEFGRQHRLDDVRSYEDFRARVPVRTYADFEPQLDRMRRGERDVLWPGLVKYWGNSSGSSSTAAVHKFLPISDTQIAWQQKAGFDVLCRYVTLSGDRSFTGGYTLNLLPPAVLKPEGPVFVTSNPGLMQLHMPRAGRLNVIPRPPVRDIEEYDKKLQAIAENYLEYDVRALSGTTCWFSILFDRVLAAARARGRDVRNIGEIWPNLRALLGGGVHAAPYLPIIRERIGHPVVLVDNYNATEGGIFAVTDRLDDEGMMVVPDRGVFYEFIPREDVGKPEPRRVPLWETEPGAEYALVVSTSSGLFGYSIGDFVRFRSVFPHRLEFTGRLSGVLSITQELTSQAEIERAVAAAAAHNPCRIVDFSAAAELGVDGTAKGRYALFVEFEQEPPSVERFASSFDEALCAENRVYREHRAGNVAILAPRVLPLVRGATRRFMTSLGQTSIQHKFPRIADDRKKDVLRELVRQGGTEAFTGAP